MVVSVALKYRKEGVSSANVNAAAGIERNVVGQRFQGFVDLLDQVDGSAEERAAQYHTAEDQVFAEIGQPFEIIPDAENLCQLW